MLKFYRNIINIIVATIATLAFTNASFANEPQLQLHLKTQTQAQTLDGIVAIVNSSVITQDQIDKQKALLIKELQQTKMPIPSDRELTTKILDKLIDVQLVRQEAKTLNIVIDDKQLDATLNGIAAQNHLTMPAFTHVVAKQGLDWDQYREQMRNQLLVSAVQQQAVGNQVIVSEQDVNNYLKTNGNALKSTKEFHLMGVVIPFPPNPTAQQLKQAMQQAGEVMKQVNSGMDMNTISLIQPTGQPVQAGDMGWRGSKQLPPQLFDALANGKIGLAIGPMPTPRGIYVFKLLASRSIPIQHSTDEFNLRHIVIKEDPLTTAETAQARLVSVRNQISKGGDFAKLALQYSQDSATATKGGDLGWISASKLGPDMSDAIGKLSVGQVSQPIQVAHGWELVQVLGRRQIKDTDAYVSSIARQYVYQTKLEEKFKEWLQQLRAKAYIKINMV